MQYHSICVPVPACVPALSSRPFPPSSRGLSAGSIDSITGSRGQAAGRRRRGEAARKRAKKNRARARTRARARFFTQSQQRMLLHPFD